MSLVDKLSAASKQVPKQQKREPLWTGPNGPGPNGGVTQGLISRWLGCRERARIHLIEGLKPVDSFNAKLEFGNMWHVCEESLAGFMKNEDDPRPFGDTEIWEKRLKDQVQKLCRQFPMQQDQVVHWHNICKTLFPVYVEHWQHQPQVKELTPLLQEQTFDVPYQLPSGRQVRLRGKWDSVDLIGGKTPGIWLMENKSKSSIDQNKIARQLSFDLQVNTYLIAMTQDTGIEKLEEVKMKVGKGSMPNQKSQSSVLGVRYNVIRRSAHKSVDSMMKKVDDDRKAGRIGEWFARWECRVQPSDLKRFKNECLNPILENLCDDWEWWDWCHENKVNVFNGATSNGLHRHRCDEFDHHPRHFSQPYGTYSVVAEGGFGDVDSYLESSSLVGLQRSMVLFPELA